jgi:hypothetical protein
VAKNLLKHCKEVSSDDKISASKRKLCEEAISNIILQLKKNIYIQLKSLQSILQLVKSLNKVSKNIGIIKYKTIRIKTD